MPYSVDVEEDGDNNESDEEESSSMASFIDDDEQTSDEDIAQEIVKISSLYGGKALQSETKGRNEARDEADACLKTMVERSRRLALIWRQNEEYERHGRFISEGRIGRLAARESGPESPDSGGGATGEREAATLSAHSATDIQAASGHVNCAELADGNRAEGSCAASATGPRALSAGDILSARLRCEGAAWSSEPGAGERAPGPRLAGRAGRQSAPAEPEPSNSAALAPARAERAATMAQDREPEHEPQRPARGGRGPPPVVIVIDDDPEEASEAGAGGGGGGVSGASHPIRQPPGAAPMPSESSPPGGNTGRGGGSCGGRLLAGGVAAKAADAPHPPPDAHVVIVIDDDPEEASEAGAACADSLLAGVEQAGSGRPNTGAAARVAKRAREADPDPSSGRVGGPVRSEIGRAHV